MAHARRRRHCCPLPEEPISECTKTPQKVCPYWFAKTFVVKYEILVLLPGGDKIVRDDMEDLAVDLGLIGVKVISVIVNNIIY